MSEISINQRLKIVNGKIPHAMHTDARMAKKKLRGLYRTLSRTPKDIVHRKIDEIEEKINQSIIFQEWRANNMPHMHFPENLPIQQKKNEIITAIQNHQIVIITGDTGSGKSTQIPKYCLKAGRGVLGKIGCTQPRRIAATSIAARIAEELGEPLGRSVGYKIRFSDRTRKESYIKVMTDGMLLAETQMDSTLSEYDTLLIDEAHERSLNIDFVLGFLKNLIRWRSDLKLIITSATLEIEKFSKSFDSASIIKVSGALYPIDVHYLKKNDLNDDKDTSHVELAVLQVQRILSQTSKGDILIFMPTEQDIHDTCGLLNGIPHVNIAVLPLYARLQARDQQKIFSSMKIRKIIVATNVAETSITIPNIQYVIDTGLARISRYSPGNRTTLLPVEPISQSSADQRKGRCGRVKAGTCYRLFTEDDYQDRRQYTSPEILRSNLAEVILRMLALGLTEIQKFPFIDPPREKNIKDGFQLLTELGAILPPESHKPQSDKSENHKKYQLTRIGRAMATIPIDPCLSRMLFEAAQRGCLREILVIVSALSIPDPRERPVDKSFEADEARKQFMHLKSDFLTLINLWNGYLLKLKEGLSQNQLRKYCKTNFLSWRRMREWQDIHSQIINIIKESQFFKHHKLKLDQSAPLNVESPGRYEAIHTSIATGLLSNIGLKKEGQIYLMPKNREVYIFPGSGLFKNAGEFIIAAEIIHTSQVFARTVASIKGKWLEDIGRQFLKYTYTKPHWDKSSNQVMALETVTLFGIPIIKDRKRAYGEIDPKTSTEVFIQHAILPRNFSLKFQFLEHNQLKIEQVKTMEAKLRCRDLLVGEAVLVAFYQERLKNVYSVKTLKQFIKKKKTDDFLKWEINDLLNYPPDMVSIKFPDEIQINQNHYYLAYVFDPGCKNDGVTIHIPDFQATVFPKNRLAWIVPGLLNEKIAFLVKNLPKNYRKRLTPVNAIVAKILDNIDSHLNQRMESVLSNQVYTLFKINVPASAWPMQLLPEHLKFNIQIVDENGQPIRQSRDEQVLQQKSTHVGEPDEICVARQKWEKRDVLQWDFGDLPAVVTVDGKEGVKWDLYPGLSVKYSKEQPMDQTTGQAIGQVRIDLKLFMDQTTRLNQHVIGVRWLFQKHLQEELKYIKKSLKLTGNDIKLGEDFGGKSKFEYNIYQKVLRVGFDKHIMTQNQFLENLTTLKPNLYKIAMRIKNDLIEIARGFQEAKIHINRLHSQNRANKYLVAFFKARIQDLYQLVPENFMLIYTDDQMKALSRFIQAISVRAQRGLADLQKDNKKQENLKVYQDILIDLLADLNPADSPEKHSAIEDFFWLLEEYKVSLFAQELKTKIPISQKRMEEKINEIRCMV